MSARHLQYRKTSWVLHLILTVLFFPWVIVWVLCYLSNRNHNANVDRQASTERQMQADREQRAADNAQLQQLLAAALVSAKGNQNAEKDCS